MKYEFPKNFLWGTATSAHQLEGNNTKNDWWEWEQRPGAVKGGARSGSACLHWDRFEEDLDLLDKRGLLPTSWRGKSDP